MYNIVRTYLTHPTHLFNIVKCCISVINTPVVITLDLEPRRGGGSQKSIYWVFGKYCTIPLLEQVFRALSVISNGEFVYLEDTVREYT